MFYRYRELQYTRERWIEINYYEFRKIRNKKGRVAHNRKIVDGRTFDSNAEYERWLELRIMERKGMITDLKEHPEFEIIPRQVSKAGKTLFRPARYTADFSYMRDGVLHVEDVKSEFTRQEKDYVLRRKLMLYMNGIYVEEVIR